MSESPEPDQVIPVLEAQLARLPLDSPARPGLEYTLNSLRLQHAAAPVVTAPIIGQRDVNLAAIQVFVGADARTDVQAARSYGYLEVLAEACGGLRPDERAALPRERVGRSIWWGRSGSAS